MISIFRKIIVSICILGINLVVTGQQLVYQTKQKNDLGTDMNVEQWLRADDGSFVLTHSVMPAKKIMIGEPSQTYMVVKFDKDGKKIFEFNTDDHTAFKKRKTTFCNNPKNGDIYAVERVDYKEPYWIHTIAKINTDGSVVTLNDVPMHSEQMGNFFYNGKLVLLNASKLGDYGKEKGVIEMVTVEPDLSVFKKQTLNIPEFTYDQGTTKYVLLDYDGENIEFYSEYRYEVDETKIVFEYEFTRYSLKEDKIAVTTKLTLDMGANCPRGSFANTSQFRPLGSSGSTEGSVHFYADHKNKVINFIGVYGEGYSRNYVKNKKDGIFVGQLNDAYELIYLKAIDGTGNTQENKQFRMYMSGIHFERVDMNAKPIVTIRVELQQKQWGMFYADVNFEKGEIEFKEMDKKYTQGQAVLSVCCAEQMSKIPEMNEKGGTCKFFQAGSNDYMLLKQKYYSVYKLE